MFANTIYCVLKLDSTVWLCTKKRYCIHIDTDQGFYFLHPIVNRDNGIGFDLSNATPGLGLSNIRSCVESLEVYLRLNTQREPFIQ